MGGPYGDDPFDNLYVSCSADPCAVAIPWQFIEYGPYEFYPNAFDGVNGQVINIGTVNTPYGSCPMWASMTTPPYVRYPQSYPIPAPSFTGSMNATFTTNPI